MGKFKLPTPEMIQIPRSAIEKLLASGDGAAALLYLYILSEKDGGTTDGAQLKAGFSEQTLITAATALARLGLIIDDDLIAETNGRTGSALSSASPEVMSTAPVVPPASRADVSAVVIAGGEPEPDGNESVREAAALAVSRDPTFTAIADECQIVIGKPLSSDGYKTLAYIYHDLELPPDVIVHLMHFCAQETLLSRGEGKKPSMKFIESVAGSWRKGGIDSLIAAEEYISSLQRNREAMSSALRALDVSGRAATKSEREFVESWLELGFEADAIATAYDKTVIATGKRTWKYADSILRGWHERGVHTPDEIESYLSGQSNDASLSKRRGAARKTRPIAPPAGPTGSDDTEWMRMIYPAEGGAASEDRYQSAEEE